MVESANVLTVWHTGQTMRYRVLPSVAAVAVLLSVVLTAGGASTATAEPAPQDPEPELQRFNRRGSLVAGSKITIHNPFGDVRLRRGGEEGGYEVAAVLQQLGEPGRRLEVRIDRAEEHMLVEVVQKNTSPATTSASREPDRSRADLVMMVPDGVTVSVTTDAGSIEAKGVQAELQLESVSGSIRAAEVDGDISGRSVSGEIHVVLGSRRARSDQVFESVTGPIAVWLPPQARYQVTMATSGNLTTDFSLHVEHHEHQEPDKIGTARIGSDGPEIRMQSRRGHLFLRRRAWVD